MTRLQFWILTGTSIFVCLLFGLQTYFGVQVQSSAQQLSRVEQLINEGRQSELRFRQVAARTYQLSLQDPTLKNVLSRQQINITVQPPADGSASSDSNASPAPSASAHNRANL